LGLPETAGTAWAARLRADQARDASSQVPRQRPAASGGQPPRPRTVLTAAEPGPPDGEPARFEAAERSARQGADPAPKPPPNVALAPLAHGDPSRIGSFRLLSRLGGGAMREVFLAASRAGRPVAVKRVRAEYARDGVFRARFARESPTCAPTAATASCSSRPSRPCPARSGANSTGLWPATAAPAPRREAEP
jgi:hypothetical protein